MHIKNMITTHTLFASFVVLLDYLNDGDDVTATKLLSKNFKQVATTYWSSPRMQQGDQHTIPTPAQTIGQTLTYTKVSWYACLHASQFAAQAKCPR
jgi:hypothetical protein